MRVALILIPLLSFAAPAAAEPIIGGTVSVGYDPDVPADEVEPVRLGSRIYVLSPLDGAFFAGGEGYGSLGQVDDARCQVGDGPGEAVTSIYRACLAPVAAARALAGVGWGTRHIARIEVGAGPGYQWFYDDATQRGEWIVSWTTRVVAALGVTPALGGAWRVGVSVQLDGVDDDRPVFAGGLVFEATVVD